MRDTSIYIEKCPKSLPMKTASFYDRSGDLVFVETELYVPKSPPFECFTAGYWVVFEIQEQGFLSYLEIIVPEKEWDIEEDLKVPNLVEMHQVTFRSPKKEGKPRIKYCANPSKDILYVGLRARKAKYYFKIGNTLIVEVASDLETVGLWILDIWAIESDEVEQKLFSEDYVKMKVPTPPTPLAT